MQIKLLSLIPGNQQLVFNIKRLIEGARLFEIPAVGTEQYPRGLGSTVNLLAARLPALHSKTRFSCLECHELFAQLSAQRRTRILVSGIETHVCVQQTVLDLLAESFEVYVAVDAVGSRFEIDRQIALNRMELAGATLTTTEATLFEWCETASDPQFKAISALVKSTP
jgi:nicotinamidase-related amidase